MKEAMRITLNLALICLFIGISLGLVYCWTQPQIVRVQKEQSTLTRRQLLPQAAKFIESEIRETTGEGKEVHYRISEGLDSGGKTTGYIIDLESIGYSSFIRIMYGVNEKGEITGVNIVSQGETPGLGTLIKKPEFLHQFLKKSPEKLELRKNEDPYKDHEEYVAALTGATISSRAVTEGIRRSLRALMKEKKVGLPLDNDPGKDRKE
jgi:Na+-translocating ferredoxin:NAD+ oxidoreductase subunit G